MKNALLSWPISYVYSSYATRTGAQLMDVNNIISLYGQSILMAHSLQSNTSPPVPCCTQADVTAVGGPSSWPGILMWTPRNIEPTINAGSHAAHLPNYLPWVVDSDGGPLPSTYYRTKEGIERFFVTDINNPAGSATAQSAIPIFWDAWSNTPGVVASTNNIASFNHVPGGSNVLYMDGHVEWVRFGAKYPVRGISDAEGYFAATGKYSAEVYARGDLVRAGGQG